MNAKLTLALVLFTELCFAWSKQEIKRDIQDFRGELRRDLLDLKKKKSNLVRVIKVWKQQELKKLKTEYERDLRLINQEFSIKLQALNQIQKIKSSDHQKIVAESFYQSIELKEEKFLRKKEITDIYFTEFSEIEKEYMDKYHNITREFAKKIKSNLNARHPAFFPAQQKILEDPWLQTQFCRQQVFYKKEQAKMDHKTYLFDLTVPMRKKREEAEVRYLLARDEYEFYRETYLSMKELNKHTKDPSNRLPETFEKFDKSKKSYFIAQAHFEKIKKSIKEVAFNLKREKRRDKAECDPTSPIGKIKIKD
ncbi:MAG: hypothetical protein CME65_07640 [Halobacteriovoraceae bacterium]|nr:hypothetical protein [Halobacteriovoraceae bacterium]|tara:strand:- start:8453 stop:9379 length:927 start_codon:yes stop_codon:yes gene_type:complete